jgi:hypothetical protein
MSGALTNIFISLPGKEKSLVKVEADETIKEALSRHLSGHDKELLDSGKLVLHTPEGRNVNLDFTGKDLTAGSEFTVQIDPVSTVG